MRTYLTYLVCVSAAVVPPSGSVQAQKTGEASDVMFTGHVLEPRKAPLRDLSLLKLPQGFTISVFAKDLVNPRMMAVSKGGDIYVTRRSVGDVLLLRDSDGDGVAETQKVVANRPQMHGIAIDNDNDTVFLVTVKDVYRAAIRSDGSLGDLDRIIDDLPDSGQHPNRTIAVGPDQMLYISVGSTCNACTESSQESATLLRATPDGTKRTLYASGLRNTIGFGWHPTTGTLVGMDNNIDWHGDDQPAEEVNVLQKGKNYGWPYVLGKDFLNPQDDPPGDVTLEQLAKTTEKPSLDYTAHSAPMQMVFYDGDAFPAEYNGDAFVAMRGSWNRKPPSGYEVIRVRFRQGKPSSIEPFLTGFLTREGENYTQFGRLAGLAVTQDGSLLVGDDENGVIYRVSYAVSNTRSDSSMRSVTRPSTTSEGSPEGHIELAAHVVEGAGLPLDVSSGAFSSDGAIPLRYSDYGEKISPPLSWSAGPAGTASYVVVVDDPDAKPNLVNHWTIFNIPSDTTSLPEGIPATFSLELPKNARQGQTTRGSVGYFGPRPPAKDGPHRYHFQVFALDAMLKLNPTPDRATLLDAMKGHILASGMLVGTFDRSPDVQQIVDSAKGMVRK